MLPTFPPRAPFWAGVLGVTVDTEDDWHVVTVDGKARVCPARADLIGDDVDDQECAGVGLHAKRPAARDPPGSWCSPRCPVQPRDGITALGVRCRRD
jgi:hypothetical protein